MSKLPKVTVTRTGSVITASDGTLTREVLCASLNAAKELEFRLRTTEPEQLVLPLHEPAT